MSSATPAIETRGLVKHYGSVVAVDHLDLRIAPGEVFGLLGPNGAGKTTTILMLLGLTEPTAGTVRVCGLDPRHQALDVKRLVGYLPDDVGFYDDLTAIENLTYTARLNRLDRATADRRIAELLGEVDLTDAGDRRVGTFSRGMRQRLGLADALVKDPAILVLDEPTVNIDPEGVRELLTLVRSLSIERGMTILLSSHLLHQVEQVCDRIGIFVAGRLRACGPIAKLAAGVEAVWTIEVGIEGDEGLGGLALQSIDGVTRVERTAGRWIVAADRDVRGEIAGVVVQRGWTVTHLQRLGADLDAIYHRYFEEATDVRVA
ncbi:MAG: ABC transporter ATP-binding protein [Ilumatobacteraceae bacterium]